MIELLTADTPNGKKISIMLEEIKFDYKVTRINIFKDEQFKPEFKKLSPFTVSISLNLEPVYAILLALYIFGESEIMSLGFYIGATIILATIVVNAYLKSKESK